MNLGRIAAVAEKEWLEIVRDRVFFGLVFIVPVLMMVLLGYGLSMDVENIPFSIVDYDKTPASRDYAYRFIGSRYFNFLGYASHERDLDRLLTDNRIRAAIIIPPDFGKNRQAGRAVAVQTLLDGTFPFRAQTTKGYIIAINSAASMEGLTGLVARKNGLTPERAQEILQPVALETRYLYNQSVVSIWSLAPKLIMLILIASSPFFTALGVVREKETGSIYNIYVSTVSRAEFLIGKLLPYIAVSTVNALVLFFFATVIFGAPFKGNFFVFLASTLIYVICTTGMGLLASVFVKTQTAAMLVTAVTTLVPSVLYSGVLIPLPSLTETARVFAHFLPAMYYTNIVTACFMKGVGFAFFWKDVAVLSLYAAILMALGYLFFHKRTRS
jgi:ABC-2 type transport system permease protein/ribosome-dependent ATPase